MRDVNLTNVQALKDDLNHSNWEIVFSITKMLMQLTIPLLISIQKVQI